MSSRSEFINLVASSGPAPHGVDQITHIIASTPAGTLSRAAKAAAPTYDQLIYDQEQGGNLVEYMEKNPVPEIALANDVTLRQQELSKPRRRLATIACFLALFAGGSAMTNKEFNDLGRGMPPQARSSEAHRLESDAFVGGVAGTLGGFVGYFAGLGFAGRLARRPAQKIVRRVKEKSAE